MLNLWEPQYLTSRQKAFDKEARSFFEEIIELQVHGIYAGDTPGILNGSRLRHLASPTFTAPEKVENKSFQRRYS